MEQIFTTNHIVNICVFAKASSRVVEVVPHQLDKNFCTNIATDTNTDFEMTIIEKKRCFGIRL